MDAGAWLELALQLPLAVPLCAWQWLRPAAPWGRGAGGGPGPRCRRTPEAGAPRLPLQPLPRPHCVSGRVL